MRELGVALLLGSFATTLGCGGDDDGSGATSAVRQCEIFLDTLCTKHASCAPATDRAKTLEDCLFVLELDLDCTTVDRVTSAYPECLDAISSATCASTGGFATPRSCSGILIAKGGF